MNWTEATAYLLVVEQQRVVRFIDAIGPEKVHILIAAQVAETAEGHVAFVASQPGHVAVGPYNDDVVGTAAVVLLTAG